MDTEPGRTLLAFIRDLKDQVECFEFMSESKLGKLPLTRAILSDLKSRLDAEAVLVRHKMREQEKKR